MKRIGVFGKTGFIGRHLLTINPEYVFVPLEGDISNIDQVRLAIQSTKVDMVVNLACLSDVEFCEKRENRERVLAVNVTGAYNVALAAEDLDKPSIFLSTDHVFSGGDPESKKKDGPYGEKAVPFPINFYGLSKFGAETILKEFKHPKIVRTSRLFNHSVLSLDTENTSYPTFIYRSFMWIDHFINAFRVYLDAYDVMPRLLHISGSETVSWYEFMSYIQVMKKSDESIMKRSGELENMAPRPHHAGLKTDLSKKLGIPQFSWRDGLRDMMQKVRMREIGY